MFCLFAKLDKKWTVEQKLILGARKNSIFLVLIRKKLKLKKVINLQIVGNFNPQSSGYVYKNLNLDGIVKSPFFYHKWSSIALSYTDFHNRNINQECPLALMKYSF